MIQMLKTDLQFAHTGQWKGKYNKENHRKEKDMGQGYTPAIKN